MNRLSLTELERLGKEYFSQHSRHPSGKNPCIHDSHISHPCNITEGMFNLVHKDEEEIMNELTDPERLKDSFIPILWEREELASHYS